MGAVVEKARFKLVLALVSKTQCHAEPVEA